ncbi:glycosyltransferase [Flavobacterium daejeonense]|uniref:glycosyltransferase n=1 Tax=Flavobacterium daejeonense TaxID=350893 RepID=UPI00054CE0CF|nr:glycosyltransferase [Flavobacterium daejeonense]
MISIIICCRKKKIDFELELNIQMTIGCEYELIVIDNSENKYSIFEAYNLGIEQSKGEYLCFIHDDILFHTQDWGNVISNIFASDAYIGLIGIAGAKMKTKMPSAWWDCPKEYKMLNIIQHLNSNIVEHQQIGWRENTIEEVVVIDGVFMVAKKLSFLRFNEKMFGFHNYDMNLSLECLINNYKIVVTKEILIEHFSLGTLNESWYTSTIKFRKLYRRYLPLKIDSLNSGVLKFAEIQNGMCFTMGLLALGNKKESLKYWLQLLLLKPYSKFHFKFLKRLIQ